MENSVRVRHDLPPAPGSGAALCRRLRASSRRFYRPTGANSGLDKTWGQGQPLEPLFGRIQKKRPRSGVAILFEIGNTISHPRRASRMYGYVDYLAGSSLGVRTHPGLVTASCEVATRGMQGMIQPHSSFNAIVAK